MFIQHPNFSIPDPGSASKYFEPKKLFLSSRKNDLGCSNRIPDPDLDMFPIPDPDPGSRGQIRTGSMSATQAIHNSISNNSYRYLYKEDTTCVCDLILILLYSAFRPPKPKNVQNLYSRFSIVWFEKLIPVTLLDYVLRKRFLLGDHSSCLNGDFQAFIN
jgi:hypothetical protein